MSWIQKLYETYNNCEGSEKNYNDTDDNKVALLPICHTTQKAQIEIVIDQDSNFIKARVIPKVEARTIIPSTESSAGRTSGESPHPLFDKLQYIASDYIDYVGGRESYFQSYTDLLSDWIKTDNNKKLKIIFDYLKKGTIIKDLVNHKILFLDNNNKLLKQREIKKENKDILDNFDLLPGRNRLESTHKRQDMAIGINFVDDIA